MGFALLPPLDDAALNLRGLRREFLHKAQCTVCPLNLCPGLTTPHMPPAGAAEPIVYMLGEAPGEDEDRAGIPFVGRSGQLLREQVPRGWGNLLRWGNCVRTRPTEGGQNRQPTAVEIECCRPSVIKDIEQTRPRAIFGFGAVPLRWALDQSMIAKWRGRRVPVKIGSHACWYFPMYHPAYVLHTEGDYNGRQIAFAFAHDLRQAFAAMEGLPEPLVHTPADVEAGVAWVTGHGQQDLDLALRHIDKMGLETMVGIDYETNRKRPYHDDSKILSVALAGRETSMAIAFDHREAGWTQSERAKLATALDKFLTQAPARKISHSLAFELEWTATCFGMETLRSKWEDTLSQAWVLDDRVHMSKPDAVSLEFLCIQYFGVNIKTLSPLDREDLDQEPLAAVLRYNGIDAKYHRNLFVAQDARLRADGTQVVYRHHRDRIGATVKTQIKGVPVCFEVVDELYLKYQDELDRLAGKIDAQPTATKFLQLVGHRYNPHSSADGVKLMHMLRAPTGAADEAALRACGDPIGPAVIAWRKAAKVCSTYIEPLYQYDIVWPDGMLHPIIGTNTTRTGRTSSDHPNIQNWIKHQEGSVEVRRQVRARPGHKIVSIDYSGIQARNVAMESQDTRLVKAFCDRFDIHGAWAEIIARQYPSWIKEGIKQFADKTVRKRYRQIAKNKLVFPAFFGAQEKTVASGLGVPPDEAARLLGKFWDQYPQVRNWQRRLREDYRIHGYVTGLTGYRRRAPVSPNELINSPIQADEGVIVCDAWIRLAQMADPDLTPILMVHDDLTFEWPAERVDELAAVAIGAMVTVPFAWAKVVPIEVEMTIGDDWCSMSDAGKYTSTPEGGWRQLAA